VIEKHDRVFIEYSPLPKRQWISNIMTKKGKKNGQVENQKKIQKFKNIPLNYKLLEKSKTTKRFTCYAYKLTANTGIGLNIDVTT